ncbi:hypothetical protein [Liquorilactobacillus mali]|uniref:hypothetical protein n=1 Tax=Liquorilactobacillus mali TaxID=1618 RepID=UPI002954E13F|nr:hypothetical protein [Liquorilactobacillus mali]MDV7757855.1 hypothetical protein [Liquorilactobacillus mali]
MKKKLIIGLVVMLGLILTGCGNRLSGSYTGKIQLFFIEQKDTWIFNGDKVTEKQNGKVVSRGTYKINGDNIKFKMGKYHINAKLSDGRKSFTITSADGLVNLVKGTTYTKK